MPRRWARGTIAECLWHHGMTRLDAVVLSHPDLDHYNALPGLLGKFSVKAVYVSSLMFEKQNQAVVALRKALDQHGIAVREVRAGDRLRTGSGSTIEVLHPPRLLAACVFQLFPDWLGRRFLCTTGAGRGCRSLASGLRNRW